MKDLILQLIVTRYLVEIEDETFNGVKLQDISEVADDVTLETAIKQLVTERRIDIICSQTDSNPHIKRYQIPPVERQLELLNVADQYHTCLYPTESVVAGHYDFERLNQKPYTKEIARGRPQLEPRFFEIGVLDRYRFDPRFSFKFSEYAGSLSILSESNSNHQILDRDNTYIQTFGLGLDEQENPRVCVFLRYLSQLSPEHQRHWETFSNQKNGKMHVNYYRSSYLGEVWEDNSAIAAIRLSVNISNIICTEIYGRPLFINEIPQFVHYSLTPFMRATRLEYSSFVLELDKLVSDNINYKFFDGLVDRHEIIYHRNGTIERKNKGTLKLLEEWLFSKKINCRSPEEARLEIIEPLRRLRRQRQTPAHSVVDNEYDVKYAAKRRELLREVAFALRNALCILLNHPKSPKIKIPDWFEDGRIDVI